MADKREPFEMPFESKMGSVPVKLDDTTLRDGEQTAKTGERVGTLGNSILPMLHDLELGHIYTFAHPSKTYEEHLRNLHMGVDWVFGMAGRASTSAVVTAVRRSSSAPARAGELGGLRP